MVDASEFDQPVGETRWCFLDLALRTDPPPDHQPTDDGGDVVEVVDVGLIAATSS